MTLWSEDYTPPPCRVIMEAGRFTPLATPEHRAKVDAVAALPPEPEPRLRISQHPALHRHQKRAERPAVDPQPVRVKPRASAPKAKAPSKEPQTPRAIVRAERILELHTQGMTDNAIALEMRCSLGIVQDRLKGKRVCVRALRLDVKPGDTFGSYTLVEEIAPRHRCRVWRVRCEHGVYRDLQLSHIVRVRRPCSCDANNSIAQRMTPEKLAGMAAMRVAGKSLKEIAKSHSCSRETARFHLKRLSKVDATLAVAMAVPAQSAPRFTEKGLRCAKGHDLTVDGAYLTRVRRGREYKVCRACANARRKKAAPRPPCACGRPKFAARPMCTECARNAKRKAERAAMRKDRAA